MQQLPLTIDSHAPSPQATPAPPPPLTSLVSRVWRSQLVSVFYQAFKFVDNMLRLIAKTVCMANSLTRTQYSSLSLSISLCLPLCVSVTVEQID